MHNTIIQVRKHMLQIKLVTIMTTKDYTTHMYLKFYPRHPFGKPNQTPQKHINIIAANRISNAKNEFEMVKRLKGEVGKYDF